MKFRRAAENRSRATGPFTPLEIFLSEWGESNSRYRLPKPAYYHYTTLRLFLTGRAPRTTIILQPVISRVRRPILHNISI